MSVLTVDRYRAITGDNATGTVTVSAKIEMAEELLADALGRTSLDEGEYTEVLHPTRDGYLWPAHLPLVSCADYTIDGHGLYGTFGPAWPNTTGGVTVTLVGGWVERSANPTAANRLPSYIEADLANAVKTLLDVGTASDYPQGATSVRLGDAAVTFGPGGAPASGVEAVRWSSLTMKWKAGAVRGAGARC